MGTEEPPGRCFPARCGAAWRGYGAAWAAAVPRTGISHTDFPVHRPSDISSGANQSPPTMVFTKHETRMLRPRPSGRDRRTTICCPKVSRITASLPTISHHFPRFPGISRPPHPPSADQVSTRRPPFLVSRPGLPPPPGRCFPARCGAAWGGYGAAWAAWGAPSHCWNQAHASGATCGAAARI